MKKQILIILATLLITTPCWAFQLTPVLQSNNEAALMEETQAHCDDVAKKAQLKVYSPEGASYFDLFNRCRELRRYLSDIAAIAVIADSSKEFYPGTDPYGVISNSFVKKYNDLFEQQVTFLNELVTDNSFSSDFVVNAEKLKTLTREVIRYNNKILEAIDSK